MTLSILEINIPFDILILFPFLLQSITAFSKVFLLWGGSRIWAVLLGPLFDYIPYSRIRLPLLRIFSSNFSYLWVCLILKSSFLVDRMFENVAFQRIRFNYGMESVWWEFGEVDPLSKVYPAIFDSVMSKVYIVTLIFISLNVILNWYIDCGRICILCSFIHPDHCKFLSGLHEAGL